jgi:coenzyme F420 hydrogenase subunit delta
VVEHLIHNYLIPEDVSVMDVGTGVRKLLFTLVLSEVKPEEIVIVDAVDWGNEVGQVSEISVDALPVTKVDDFSMHQVPTSNMLRELQDQGGIEVMVVACDVGDIPQLIEPGLSQTTVLAVGEASQLLAERFRFEKKPRPA